MPCSLPFSLFDPFPQSTPSLSPSSSHPPASTSVARRRRRPVLSFPGFISSPDRRLPCALVTCYSATLSGDPHTHTLASVLSNLFPSFFFLSLHNPSRTTAIMNHERRQSRRIRFTPAKQRMVDPDAWTTDEESSPHPAAEELLTLPVPTASSSGTNTNAYDALRPLITQPADPVSAAIARRQNTVVTVTSTQFSGTVNPNSSGKQDDGVPIVTIAVSAGVGVFLAVTMVGCWWWFCKRPYTRRHKVSAIIPSPTGRITRRLHVF